MRQHFKISLCYSTPYRNTNNSKCFSDLFEIIIENTLESIQKYSWCALRDKACRCKCAEWIISRRFTNLSGGCCPALPPTIGWLHPRASEQILCLKREFLQRAFTKHWNFTTNKNNTNAIRSARGDTTYLFISSTSIVNGQTVLFRIRGRGLKCID